VKKAFDDRVGSLLSRWVTHILPNARVVATTIVAVTLVLLAYTAMNLGINSDNVQMIDEDLPSRIALEEFAKLFPILNNAFLIVVDGKTPELARDATAALEAHLAAKTGNFHNVYIPGGGEFFETNGLLYRSVDDLYDFADHIAAVQPMIAELERDSSIANLSQLIQTGLDNVGSNPESQKQWSLILDRLSSGAATVFDEYPLAISWEEFLLSGSALEVSTRRVILAEPNLDFEAFLPAQDPIDAVRDSIAELELTPERGITVRLTGNPVLNHEEMLGIAWDVIAGGVFCFVLVGIVLVIALRSWRLAAAALVTLLVGLVWTAAFATAAIGHLNLISLSFAVLFIGLGVDFAIHLGMNYAALRQDGLEHEPALFDAIDYVGSSLVLCTLTTSIGFFAFVPTDYAAVAELGLIAGTGMLFILFLTMTMFPALVSSWLSIPDGITTTARLRFRNSSSGFLQRHAKGIRWAALAAALASVATLPSVTFEPNAIDMRDPETESVQAFNDIAAANDRGSPWYANAIAPDLAAADALAEQLAALDLVSHTVTLSDYVPSDQEEKAEILADLALILDAGIDNHPEESELTPALQLASLRGLRDYLAASGFGEGETFLEESVARLEGVLDDFVVRVEAGADLETALTNLESILLGQLPTHLDRLRSALDPEPIELATLPRQVVDRMITSDQRARVIAYPAENLQGDAFALERFVDAVHSVQPDATGMAANMIAFGRATVDSLAQALFTALIAISLLLWLLWRHITEMLLVLAPLLLGAALTCATMVAFGIAFNFANVIVIPLLLGIGVDSAIHLVHSSNVGSEGEAGLLGNTTSRAIFYSAGTTVASFGALGFSAHRGIASLGVTLVIGLIYTLVCTLIVLPALIEWRREVSEK
jgi:hopanoid biosynthesis associated RND transporter like protein HpnN